MGCKREVSLLDPKVDQYETTRTNSIDQQSPLPPSPSERSTHSPLWLFVGDSLTAGYGLEPEFSFVSRLQEKILQEEWVDPISGQTPKLKNAGVSGDTSAGTLRRMTWLLSDGADRVFLCIGANDGMRGQPIKALKSNLSEIARRIKSHGASLHLSKILLPPNYGAEYTKRFAQSYEEVAMEEGLSLFPFLLRGVAGERHLNQVDGIHPNAAGHQKIADQLLTHLAEIGLIVKRSSIERNQR